MAKHPKTGTELLFIADTGNHAIRVIDVLHRVSRTIGGSNQLAINGQTKALVYPRGVAIVTPNQVTGGLSDDTWQLLVSDQNRIVRLTFMWSDLFVTSGADPKSSADVLAGSLQRGSADGPGAIAQFSRPHGLQLLERFDRKGNSLLELYIADFGNHKVRRMIVSTNLVDTILEVGLKYPRGLALDPGRSQLFVCDQTRIVSIDCSSKVPQPSKAPLPIAGKLRRGHVDRPGEMALFSQPYSIFFQGSEEHLNCDASGGVISDVGSAGRLVVADFSNHRVRAIDMATKVVSTII